MRAIETIIVDINKPESIAEMCSKAKLIINCVGPVRVVLRFQA